MNNNNISHTLSKCMMNSILSLFSRIRIVCSLIKIVDAPYVENSNI